MNDSEILIKAMGVVAKNDGLHNVWPGTCEDAMAIRSVVITPGVIIFGGDGFTYNYYNGLYSILFDHNFAKAFFGQDEVCAECGMTKEEGDRNLLDCCMIRGEKLERWQFCLKAMVLQKNPIQYLGKFLKND